MHLPLRVGQELSTETLVLVPLHQSDILCSLECKDYTVAFGIGFPFDVDFAVYHGHDAISKLKAISLILRFKDHE